MVTKKYQPLTKTYMQKIRDSKAVGGVSLSVLELFFNNNNTPMSADEVHVRYIQAHPFSPLSKNEVAKRLSTLTKRGVLAKAGTTNRNADGKKVTTWYATGNFPNNSNDQQQPDCSGCGGCGQQCAQAFDYTDDLQAQKAKETLLNLLQASKKLRKFRFLLPGKLLKNNNDIQDAIEWALSR